MWRRRRGEKPLSVGVLAQRPRLAAALLKQEAVRQHGQVDSLVVSATPEVQKLSVSRDCLHRRCD